MKSITIKKGEKYSTLWSRAQFFPFFTFFTDEFLLEIEITDSMFSKHEANECKSDSNKLGGGTQWFWQDHHWKSARLSYHEIYDHPMFPRGYIQFIMYYYIGGVRGEYNVGGMYGRGAKVELRAKTPFTLYLGRRLFSYHGGTCTAVRDIIYKMKFKYLWWLSKLFV